MAEAIIGPLVGRLQEIVLGEARALVAVNYDILRLRDKLMWLQAFLREADPKRRVISNEINKVWLQQTRDAVFDAEDAIDHYHLRMSMSRYPRWARPTVRCVTTFTTQVHMRRVLSRKINFINSRLEEIIENKNKYKMENAHSKTDLAWKPSTSISYVHRRLDDLQQSNLEIYVEEREKLRQTLVTLTEQEVLQSEGRHPVVVSVSGKSGVGKTTLVRDTYKEMAKMKCFDVQAMECFAPYLSAGNILQQILQQLTKDDENVPRRMVDTKLKAKLENKKYLLVIDGEVSGTEWKNILTTLPTCLKGSRIVHITLRKPEEPPSGYHHVPILLDKLENKATIELFRKRLCHVEVPDEGLNRYHQGIYEITEGLPLTVVLLSGLVQTKEFPGEWDNVFLYLESKKSKRLDSMLSVCFDDLPHDLKCCLLYFAALPSNTIIEARSLVCMWMAEGFLRQKVGKSMEKIGYIYLHELIARNLVNLVQMDDGYSGLGIVFVTIQNKVHDYLSNEAHEASFLEVHSGDDIPTLTGARRLSLQNYTDKYAILASPLPKLRSIFSQFEQEPKQNHGDIPERNKPYLCLSPQQRAIYKQKKDIKSHISELFHGSEFLRVINLQGIEIGEKLPNAIGNVVHLQYLGVTSCSLKYIPSSIGSLTSLQTLDVRETNVRELPKSFWMIKTLRHVFGFVLKLPKKIGKFKELHTLDSIVLEVSEQASDGTLEEMIHLEYLSIWRISSDHLNALSVALNNLESLRTLMLYGDKIPSSVFTTISLRRLKFMDLDGDLESSSDINGNDGLCLPNLTTLSLKRTKVTQEFICKLAELPSLATLMLYPGSYTGKKLAFCSSRFQQLRKLKIDVETLKRVELDVKLLPKLEVLDIYSHHTHHHVEIDVGTTKHEMKARIIVDLKKSEVQKL